MEEDQMRAITAVVLLMLLAACGPTEPDTAGPARGPVFIENQQVLILESIPVQFRLQLSGMLPTPCHSLGWEMGEPDEEGVIDIQVFSLADSDLNCIQVLEPFETSLDLGSLPSGEYVVRVNGEVVGGIEAP
jgi:hypothetical protein